VDTRAQRFEGNNVRPRFWMVSRNHQEVGRFGGVGLVLVFFILHHTFIMVFI
jgi:hypothetical protein